MCGICAILFFEKSLSEEFYIRHIKELLNYRGPDDSDTLFENGIFYGSSILWHQGRDLIKQPIHINDKILLFNGDLFMDEIIESDTNYLMEKLRTAKSDIDLISVFKAFTGPFSIIFYFDKSLYFIRDSLGRNSLIIGKCKEGLFLTSVIDDKNENIQALEVPPLGLYKISLDDMACDLYPFQEITHEHHVQQLNEVRKIVNVTLREETINPDWLMYKQPKIHFSFDDVHFDEIDTSIVFSHLLGIPAVNDLCSKFIELLSKSVQDRVTKTQKECKMCLKTGNNCHHSNVSVLFSGGVDCSLLAVLASSFIDKDKPIDLLNVAFEKVSNKSAIIDYNVPDRLTGLQTVEELRQLCPERRWNFVEINITRKELYEHRKVLRSLVYPLSNVLDEDLGMAIYFASRGKGVLEERIYESPSRVILMGSGADELFGGYSRHRNAYRRSTAENDLVTKELELDWIRLPSRNLARDDRVVSGNSSTVRAPYVEENFVNFARNLKVTQRCCFKLPEGIGDKLLLRLCAYKVGVKNCCQFKKRALQFGSRIADKRQSAGDKSKLLEKEKC